jgi:ribulose 1,5-bisphosphate synthetase/thiazole synthase
VKNKNRRNFLIKSLAGFTLAIIPNKVFSSSEPEIIVIGAGAAGLAATEHLIKNRKSSFVLFDHWQKTS